MLPADHAYGADRLLYNAKFVDLHPAALAYCATGEDVARCVAFATDHDVDVVARSGGHSYGGYSNCAGLVIDVSRLSAISVDTKSNTAVVGSTSITSLDRTSDSCPPARVRASASPVSPWAAASACSPVATG